MSGVNWYFRVSEVHANTNIHAWTKTWVQKGDTAETCPSWQFWQILTRRTHYSCSLWIKVVKNLPFIFIQEYSCFHVWNFYFAGWCLISIQINFLTWYAVKCFPSTKQKTRFITFLTYLRRETWFKIKMFLEVSCRRSEYCLHLFDLSWGNKY